MESNVLESYTERTFTDKVNADGNYCVKLEIRHWPDRIIILEKCYCFFIEFKRKGKKPKLGQRAKHNTLKNKGHHVYVCTSWKQAMEVYQNEVRSQKEAKSSH